MTLRVNSNGLRVNFHTHANHLLTDMGKTLMLEGTDMTCYD